MRARRQRQKMVEISAPGMSQNEKGLNAVTERFIRETCTLDRDTQYLDSRLQEPTLGPRLGEWRGSGFGDSYKSTFPFGFSRSQSSSGFLAPINMAPLVVPHDLSYLGAGPERVT